MLEYLLRTSDLALVFLPSVYLNSEDLHFWIPPSSSQILQCLLNSGEITGVEHLWIFGADCSQLPSLFVTVFTNSISIHYLLSLVVVVCILWIFIFAQSWLQLYSSIRKEFVFWFFLSPASTCIETSSSTVAFLDIKKLYQWTSQLFSHIC